MRVEVVELVFDPLDRDPVFRFQRLGKNFGEHRRTRNVEDESERSFRSNHGPEVSVGKFDCYFRGQRTVTLLPNAGQSSNICR